MEPDSITKQFMALQPIISIVSFCSCDLFSSNKRHDDRESGHFSIVHAFPHEFY